MFEVDNRMNLIRPVLIGNYFAEINENVFTNDKCRVEVDLENEFYSISFRDRGFCKCMVSSDNLNLYWLFGFMAANDLVSRDFKI